jgi:hypothetical protein
MTKENAKGKWSMSQRLQFAAFMVAGPRYIALGAMALGVQPESTVPFFLYLEIGSWLGFAMLEGYAIPYIAKGIRRFVLRSFEWWQLQVYRALLLLAIPALGSPLYLAISQKQTMLESLGVGGFVVWAFLLTGMGALVIDAVGTCESVNEPEVTQGSEIITIRKGNIGLVAVEDLAKFYADTITKRDQTVTPDQFAAAFKQAQGVALTTDEAEAALAAARNGLPPVVHGGNGRRKGAV